MPARPVTSVETCRAPGATIADKAAVCLLLGALATLWLFERNYILEENTHRPRVTMQSLTLAPIWRPNIVS